MHAEVSEEKRREQLSIADAIAPSWERRRPEVERVAAPVREWMLRELRPEAGQTVLELACGAGDTGFEAAKLIGETGRLISTDFSSAMLDAARRRGTELGVANVDYRVLDAEQIDLDPDSVDGVLCRFAFMLMLDPAAAFAGTRRVLREGGRLALAVWGPAERNPFFTAAVAALVKHGHIPPPDPAQPGVFALADAERTRSLLEASGFREVRTEEVPVSFVVPDVDGYLDWIADTAGPMGLALQRLSGPERDEIGGDCEEALGRFEQEGSLSIPGLALCAVAS